MGVPASLSSVPDVAPYIQYIAAGGQTVYPYPFPITEDSDLVVVVDGVTQGDDATYAVSGVGNATGGNVTLNSGSTAGDIITLYRDIPIERISQIAQNSGFSSQLFNNEFNNFYLIAQQLQAAIAQCLQIPVTNNPAPTTLLAPGAYAGKYLSFDANGNPQPAVLTSSGSISAALINGLTNGQTPNEQARGVVPTNLLYPTPGDMRRYGADPSGVSDSSVALAQAVQLGYVYIAQGCTYKILTGATAIGQVVVVGEGQTSKILCDGAFLTVTSGSNSFCDNFWMGAITAPWIITRNPANWAADVSATLQQSLTVAGYQPTANDIDIYSSLTTPQKTQDVGCVLLFTGASSEIVVSRIFGTICRVQIMDSLGSTVRDCRFRGGKGTWGSIVFDNWTNGFQRGRGNRALSNRIGYASTGTIIFMANDDFEAIDNVCYRGGESGVKTLQANGVLFSASVGSATSGTISQPSAGFALANGTWTFEFSSGDVRTVTISGASASWSGALASATILTASAYQTTLNPQCFRGKMQGNRTYENYYDCFDFASTYNTTVDAARTYHQIVGNYGYNSGGTGMNADGQFNTYVANHLYQNYTFGLWGNCSNSLIESNHCLYNNVGNSVNCSELLGGPAGAGNSIIGNRVVKQATNGYPIYASQVAGAVPHFIDLNVTIGGTNFFGNYPAIIPILGRNVDATTGPVADQSFCVKIVNNAGTLQHIFYADASETGPGNFGKIVGATSGALNNTPTGTDASTAFVAGAKIGSAATNILWLNTAVQDVNNVLMTASVTGAPGVSPVFESINIGGVAQLRLGLLFTTSSGGAFALNTTNITAGNAVKVQFYGKLA